MSARGGGMPGYRIYSFVDGHRIAGPSTEIECDSDEEAITAAKALLDNLDLEVWQEARIVIRLKATDK